MLILWASPFDSAAASDVVKSEKVVNLADITRDKEQKGQSGWIPEDGNHQMQTSLPQSTVGEINRAGEEPGINKT